MGCVVLKIKGNREILIFIILIPIFLWLVLNFSSDKNNKSIPYSILNRGTKGISIMYEAMEKLNYPVNLVLERVEDRSYGELQVVITQEANENFDINDEHIRKWIQKGGKLIYLRENWEEIPLNYGEKIDAFYSENNKKAAVLSFEKGVLLVGDSSLINNKALSQNTDGAYWILKEIDKMGYKSIEFNEFYQYVKSQRRSLWRDTPKGVKLVIYQIVFLAAAIIFYKGKRFGKPVPFYEEVERTENEYIFSVASLYRQTGCWELVLESYYEDFLLELERSFGRNEDIGKEWLRLWKEERLPKVRTAKELYNFINNKMNDNKDKKAKGKRYLEKIFLIEQLKKTLLKRREDHWKILQKDM